MKNTNRLSTIRPIIFRGPALAMLLAAAPLVAQAPADSGGGGLNLKPASLSAVIERVVKRLDQATADKGTRLAVATFVSTGSPAGGKSEFGEYFSETLTSAIRARVTRARLYERKRLDLVLSEHELNVSDLVDENEALRIGELVPVDALLAGVYTAFDTYIDVSLRLVDISTGRILFTETDRILMDKDLAALIARERGETAAAGGADRDPCAETEKEIETLLKDLSSPAKVKALVKAATAVPFDMSCGKIHFGVMATLKRYKINDPDYRRFLLSQLGGVKFPSQDERAYYIFNHLAADNLIDGEEWKAGLETVRRAETYSISRLLSILLITRDEQTRNAAYYRTAQERMKEVIALAEQGKVGLPVPATVDQIFSELIDAFNYAYTEDNLIVYWVYETLGSKLSADEKSQTKVWSLLRTMYPRETGIPRKKKILDWAIDYFSRAGADEKSAERFFDLVKDFQVTDYKKKHPEELKKYPADHWTLLVRHHELFRKFTPLTRFKSQLEDRVDICLENDIEIPGVVPTAREAAALLKNEDWNQRLRASEMLVKMGSRAAPAENTLVALFDDDEGGSGATVSRFRNNAVTVLGNIKTDKPKSLKLLLEALDSRDYGVSQTATRSFILIGAPAIPYLIRGLESEAGGVQYKAASALAKIGPPAKAALPKLRELSQSRNRDLRSISVKAIAAIEGE